MPAPDAERLMRSRYSAFAIGHDDHLLRSWHPTTRPATLEREPGEPPVKWIGLEVLSHRVIDETHSEVEFIARYRVGGRAFRLHETSRFIRENGYWFYVDGTLHES